MVPPTRTRRPAAAPQRASAPPASLARLLGFRGAAHFRPGRNGGPGGNGDPAARGAGPRARREPTDRGLGAGARAASARSPGVRVAPARGWSPGWVTFHLPAVVGAPPPAPSSFAQLQHRVVTPALEDKSKL